MKKWFRKMSIADRVMVIGAVVLTLAVLSLTLYGVLHHTEQGLLTACDTPNGALDYNGDCSQVKWNQSQIPLQVYIESSNPYPPLAPDSALSSVVSHINHSFGFRLLSATSNEGDADIRVDFASAAVVSSLHLHNANGGALHHRKADGSLWCEVRTWNTGTAELADKALTHELGHCLGLTHDDFPASAMYPRIVSDSNFRPTRLRFTDYDRALLHRLYH